MSRRFNTVHATEWLRGQFSGRLLTVLDRDGWRCRYCGAKLNRMTASMDHVTPKARGGKDNLSNLVACCKPCNKDKGDRTLGEWTPKIIPKFMRSRRTTGAPIIASGTVTPSRDSTLPTHELQRADV